MVVVNPLDQRPPVAHLEGVRQAVEEEQVKYLQLSDIEGITWKLYNFNGIPFITLISPDGVILERNLRGTELRKKVEEYILGAPYASVKKGMDEINEQYNKLVEVYRGVGDVMKKAEMWEKVKLERQKRADFLLKGLKQLEGSVLGVSLVKDNLFWLEGDYNVFQSAVQALGNRVPESELKTEVWNKFEKLKAEQLTGEAPDFVLLDKRGKEVRLSSFRGKKEVLLDFWASWCGPCRKEMKSLRELYKELEGQGVRFVSISLDDSEERWKKACEEEQIPWLSALAEGGWEKSTIRKALGIESIPHIIVVDKEGKIAAKNARRNILRERLEEILNKK